MIHNEIRNRFEVLDRPPKINIVLSCFRFCETRGAAPSPVLGTMGKTPQAPPTGGDVLDRQLQAAAHVIQSAYRRHAYNRRCPVDIYKELQKLFWQYDADRDGSITLDEPVLSRPCHSRGACCRRHYPLAPSLCICLYVHAL